MSVNQDQYNLDKIWETDLKTLLYPLQRRKVVSYSNTVKSNKPQNQKLGKEWNTGWLKKMRTHILFDKKHIF